MTWYDPQTWVDDNLVTATQLRYARNNQDALKFPPTYLLRDDGRYSTTSTSYVEISSANMAPTVITNGGAIMLELGATFNVQGASSQFVFIDIDVDGTYIGVGAGYDAIWHAGFGAYDAKQRTFSWLLFDLAAGEHTFTWMWKLATTTPELRLYSYTLLVRELT